MKKDVYLKVVLTVIAICLIWICIREILHYAKAIC